MKTAVTYLHMGLNMMVGLLAYVQSLYQYFYLRQASGVMLLITSIMVVFTVAFLIKTSLDKKILGNPVYKTDGLDWKLTVISQVVWVISVFFWICISIINYYYPAYNDIFAATANLTFIATLQYYRYKFGNRIYNIGIYYQCHLRKWQKIKGYTWNDSRHEITRSLY